MLRLVDRLPTVVSISEVDFITSPMVEHVKHEIEPAELTWRPYNIEAMAIDLLWSGLVIQSKNLREKKVFIKPRSSSLANLELMTSSSDLKAHAGIDLKHMCMYRDPVPNMKSIASMFNLAEKISFLSRVVPGLLTGAMPHR